MKLDMVKSKIEDKHLYFTIIVLGVILIYQLIKLGSIYNYFPLRGFADGTTYIGRFFLLAKYGYHNFAPNWYNGTYVLTHFAPGWFFFTLPIYWITQSVENSVFISIVISLLLVFLFLVVLGKSQKISLAKTMAFFLMFVLSPSFYSNLFDLGRMHDLFSLTTFVLGFILIMKKKVWDFKWLALFTLVYGLIILNQPTFAIFFSFLVLGVMWTMKWKERMGIGISIGIAALLTSFFWVPFIDNKGTILEVLVGVTFSNYFSYGTLISLLFLVSFYFYWKDTNWSRRELKIYLPILILGVLYATRLVSLIPFLDKTWPNSYNLFFTFLTLFFLFKTNFKVEVRKLITVGIYLIPFLVIGLTFIYPTESFEHSERDIEILSIFSHVDERVLIVSAGEPIIDIGSLIAYGTIYHNIETPDGWYSFSASAELFEEVLKTKALVKGRGSCEEILENLESLEVRQVMALSDSCEDIKKCGLEVVVEKKGGCLLEVRT
jgi:hypothetical protein